MPRTRASFALAFVVAMLAFVSLGRAVSSRPPTTFDTLAAGESGRFVDVALWFTHAGLFGPYAALCVTGLAFGLVRRRWLTPALFEVVLLLAVWRVSDAFKEIFRRPRPVWWYRVHESSYSYASGHAALSLAFYGFAAYVIVRSDLPVVAKRAAIFACGIMVLGIGWSRLALGAHFPTDLIGGYCLAIAGLCAAVPAFDAVRARTRSHAVPSA